VTAAALTVAERAEERPDWADHLTSLIDPDWRRAEWDSSTGIFTADPTNPMSKVFACRVAGCAGWSAHSISLCSGCRKRRLRFAGTVEEFSAVERPPARKDMTTRLTVDLSSLAPAVRAELIFGIQQRDHDQIVFAPLVLRRLLASLPQDLTSVLDLPDRFAAALLPAMAGLLRGVLGHVRRAHAQLQGIDPTIGDVWDSALVGLIAGSNRQYRAMSGTVDFRPVRQSWLRRIVKDYGRSIRPSAAALRRIVGSFVIASDVLTARGVGDDPSMVGMADMTAVVQGFNRTTRPDGRPHSTSQRIAMLGFWRRTLEFSRLAGLMDDIPTTFAMDPRHHKITHVPLREDELGRAIPEAVIAQLDRNLHLLRTGSRFHVGGWAADDIGEMYCAIYAIMRDTGRRPNEVVSLHRDCLQFVDGSPTLIWDNHKRRRLGRRLPIHTSTADIITKWQQQLATLPQVPHIKDWLFPGLGSRPRETAGHVTAQHFLSKVFRAWVDRIDEPFIAGTDSTGQPRVISKDSITAYGLRHAYAQRHADNGTPVDVLRELMDHRSVETTMGYYKITLTRKQLAINAVASLRIDRHGNPDPVNDAVAYQRQSVSIPFGNCIEPSNVKAGGQHCPIRYQCSGCGFYRPDPSYLNAIDEHITSLRSDLEIASAADNADWVLTNLRQQIDSFAAVADRMRAALTALPASQQEAIRLASDVLRRSRASEPLSLTVINRTGP
jgi:integrase